MSTHTIEKFCNFSKISSPFLTSAFALWARLHLGYIFFTVGLGRLKDWESQSFLFEEIHPVPFIPSFFSAVATTAGEIILPIFLFLGLATRLGAFGLLIMTLVIQFIVGATPEGTANNIANPVHYFWMFMALYLVLYGGGKLSLDTVVMKKFCKKN